MSWTQISKPGAQTYTNVNPNGKEQYDQASLSYDDADTFYDGTNPDMWSFVAKPSNGMTGGGGMTMGLLIPLTRPTGQVPADPWTYVPKPL